MSVNDLHSADYLGFDYPPMSTVEPKAEITVPLFVSSFTDKYHGKDMKVFWETELETGIFGRKKLKEGCFDISYDGYGTKFINSLKITAPDEDGILIAKLYLKDSQENIVMSNFVLFDVYSNVESSVSLADAETDGFKRAWLVQEGNKLNCLGCGRVSFAVNKKDIQNEQAEIVFEASSREEMAKDIESKEDKNSRNDLDLVRGCFEERGINEE